MATIEQREIVTVQYPVSAHPHPAVVLSTDDANFDWVVCVMITSTGMDNEFSFHLKDELLERGSFSKPSQIRLHVVGGFEAEFVKQDRRPRKLKVWVFKNLIKPMDEFTSKGKHSDTPR